jgi:hypothetical protein
MHVFTGAVNHPRAGMGAVARGVQQLLDRILVAGAGHAGSIRVTFELSGDNVAIVRLARGVSQWTKTHQRSLSQKLAMLTY